MAESSTITREGGAAGYVLVPREPTGEMYGAGGVAQFKADFAQTPVREAVGSVYRAMIAAAPTPDPASIAASLEEAADRAGTDAVWCSSDERAIAQVQRASTYRRLAAVLRQPGFGEARHG